MDDIAIGKIRTSHGVNGFVKVLSFSGQTDHFLKLKEFVLKKDCIDMQYTLLIHRLYIN